MATTAPTEAPTTVYSLVGSLLEICSCGVLCPCFVGADPDGGECFGLIAHHIDHGQIDGIDVSGTTIATLVHIPGNVMDGSWRVVLVTDAAATAEQRDAMVRAFGGDLGGPLADLAGLVGEVVAVEVAPIHHNAREGRGSLRIEGIFDAEIEPITSPDGARTTLRDTAFSTVPNAPAFAAKATRNDMSLPQYGLEWSHEGRNAIQTAWRTEHRV